MFDMVFVRQENIGNHFCLLTFTCRNDRSIFPNNTSNIMFNYGAYHLINEIVAEHLRIHHNTPLQNQQFPFQIQPDNYTFDMMFLHHIFASIYGIYGYFYNSSDSNLNICTSSKYINHVKNVIRCLRNFNTWSNINNPELIELQKEFQRHNENKILNYATVNLNGKRIAGFKLEKKLTKNFTYCVNIWNDEIQKFQFTSPVINGRYHRKYKTFLNHLSRLVTSEMIVNEIAEVHINNSLMNIVFKSRDLRHLPPHSIEESYRLDQIIIHRLLETIF